MALVRQREGAGIGVGAAEKGGVGGAGAAPDRLDDDVDQHAGAKRHYREHKAPEARWHLWRGQGAGGEEGDQAREAEEVGRAPEHVAQGFQRRVADQPEAGRGAVEQRGGRGIKAGGGGEKCDAGKGERGEGEAGSVKAGSVKAGAPHRTGSISAPDRWQERAASGLQGRGCRVLVRQMRAS
ncbi:hypothetical protein GALL_465570 [mine drainage metagenome]|uniref:Uncharacterized protein n=1 Tax=mine drainage metagenome TaxID=410659 RepID=A0A1J5PLX5_9ZZZZ